jgi:hypothetical protein
MCHVDCQHLQRVTNDIKSNKKMTNKQFIQDPNRAKD